MKILKYNLCTIVGDKEVLSPVSMGWNEANEAIAKAEAYNGEYIIEDDGQPNPVEEATANEILDILLGVLE